MASFTVAATVVCSSLLGMLLIILVQKYRFQEAENVSYSGRHLMSTDEEDDFVENIPQPELIFYAISGSDFPYVEGGGELRYAWQLNHRVEEEHTAVIVSFEVDIPSSTFHVDSLNITISSHAFELKETRVLPFGLEHSADEEKVRFSVDLGDYLWVNLTEPWKRPDCWWTKDKICYPTDYTECVFLDMSPNQNWDPFFCRRIDIESCLPSNVTSECFYIDTMECLEQVYQTLGNRKLARCPELYNTSCIQVNERGLFYGQYDWTRPTPEPPPPGYEKELCGVINEEMWDFEEIIDSFTYVVEIFISVDEETGCTVVQMTPKEAPLIETTTYNPYLGIPITDEYILAKQCLNVNTTGYYTPPIIPIRWKDFNISVAFTGTTSNYVLVNQVFVSNLLANVTQVSKPPDEQLTNVTASLEYEVKLPWVGLSAIPTFSDNGQALKHEKIDHQLSFRFPHAISFGMKVTVTFQKITDKVKMSFLNETPSWYVSGNMVSLTSGFMVNETHDNHGLVTMDSMMDYMERDLLPSVRYAFYESKDVEGLADSFELEIPPFICIDDGEVDTVTVNFSSRVLTTVLPEDVLKLPLAIVVVNSPRRKFSGGGAPTLTVVDQPFIPLVSPIYPQLHPDTGDDFIFSFDLVHLLDVAIFDIWMNVSCPDLHTVSSTLILGFMEPINVTTDSEYDLAVVMKSSLHFHLLHLTPDTNFCGNQTFHMWDNRMLTHQPTFCSIYLSYRKEGKDLVLPYEAANIKMFTLPGITFDLYEKELPTNTSMYEMAVGSNATFVVNITFPETSTEFDVTLTMPSPVLAVYSSLVTHQGSNLAFINATEYEVQPLDVDIDTWPMGSRTVVDLHFGTISNSADNEETYQGDNLVFEFNCVLRDTITVVKDTAHTLAVTMSHSGSEDLEKESSVLVLEPDVHLDFRLTNQSIAGDPGDVFRYHLTINHTERSQTPAHHMVIRFSLPYMGVYQDFVPGNGSEVPRTNIYQELGVLQADSVLELYLYKLDMDQIISGTFLIKISTKLTQGLALLATANYTIESFYQWGRSYPYTTVSENVINIRNATLYFLGTSQPQTKVGNVTIHEQVSYKLYIPLPPIGTNLTLMLDLPQREVTIKKWEAEKLRSQIPKRPPVEQTFYDQGCSRKYTSQTCYCYQEEQNYTMTTIVDSDEDSCWDVKMDNCTAVVNETASLILLRTEVDRCTSTNTSTVENCTDGGKNCSSSANATSSLDKSINCSISQNETAVDHEVCFFSSTQRERCMLRVLQGCRNNPEPAQKWPFVTYKMKRICENISYFENSTSDGDVINVSYEGTTAAGVLNYTELRTGEYDLNMTMLYTEDTVTTYPPEFLTDPSVTSFMTPLNDSTPPYPPEFSTDPTVNTSFVTLVNASTPPYTPEFSTDPTVNTSFMTTVNASTPPYPPEFSTDLTVNMSFVTHVNASTPPYPPEFSTDPTITSFVTPGNASTNRWWEVCKDVWEVDCHHFSTNFCSLFTMKNCSEDFFGTPTNSSANEETRPIRTCFCNDQPTPLAESAWSRSPYYICENTTEAELLWATDQSLNETELNFDICEEEETLILAVADVISTEVTSTREGAVCHFVGGNRHNPLDAGVTYYAAYLPANDTDIGDSVSAIVTMVILDDASLSRGDILRFNGTSAFSYVTKLSPPNSIFRENCTCTRLLVHFFDPDSSIDCSCETMRIQNMNQSDCNFTSSYQDEDTEYPLESSCGCINYCRGNVSYFENPLKTFDKERFEPDDLCDCHHVNQMILHQEPSFLDHMESCDQSHPRNYSCDIVNVIVTHRTVDTNQNCTCIFGSGGVARCTCNPSAIVDSIEATFSDEIYEFQDCNNGLLKGDEYHFNLSQSDCVCLEDTEGRQDSYSVPTELTSLNNENSTAFTSEETSTAFLVNFSEETPTAFMSNFSEENSTMLQGEHNKSTTNVCSCSISCIVNVEERSLNPDESQPFDYHFINYTDNYCECEKRYTVERNISAFLEWTQTTGLSSATESPVLDTRNISCANCSASTSNESRATEVPDYRLHCYCFNSSRNLKDVPEDFCVELDTVEHFDSECFVPPDNHTQFILDHWDYNATIIDQMVTVLNHEVVIIEPELQVTMTRHPLPAIVDRIDMVAFDFEVSHTASSDSPAFNVHLQLDAVNFTRNYALGELMPSLIYSDEHCTSGNLCKEKYSNKKGLFHLPYLPVEPAGVAFFGTFNLSVGNEIDFVADSLLTARSIVTYDSCIVDFIGRGYGPINASDTVQIDAPTVSGRFDFCTAYSYLFYSSNTDEIPRVFSVGDYVRVRASLWVPEVTLHLTNFTISSDMVNVTFIYGEVFLTDQIWNRNDTGSVYQELSSDPFEGLLHDGLEYAQAKFQDGGVTIVPGIVINKADNVADEDDYLLMTLTFRAKDVSSWYQGLEANFVISASYRSDYHGELVTLQDDTVKLTMVEPQLSLRVEILDHQFLVNQTTNHAAYTCHVNDCCETVSCDTGNGCLTDVENIEECSSAECLCTSGFVSHEEGGCSAVGRTSGDIITFGLTATHHPDFTGNAFDVIILVRSDLSSSLLPNSHFISHPFAPDYISMLSMPSLTQTSDSTFMLYIKRFNQLQICERFAVPFRVDPAIRLRAGESWSANASLTYYSAKPYGIAMELNTNSRFYEFDGENSFVFHAPTPSAEFYMMPTSGTTSKIDFRIYSSSNQNHTVTANVGGEMSVTFQIKFVIPKVLTDLNILIALPEGSGFRFQNGSLIFQGSQVLVSETGITETTDINGRPYVYITCPDVYSVPDIIEKQRPFNGTIQRKFKSMLGDTQPYPSEPACTEINSTSYENPLNLGCYNDSKHYFPITMATEDHPTQYNLSLSMTNQLCYQLCRGEGFFISGTKNGSSCYCGNFTSYQQYKDHAGTIHQYVNTTVEQPYTEIVWVACNKTGITWTNQTVSKTCLDDDTYQDCVADKSYGCKNQMYAVCLANFMDGVDCFKIANDTCGGSSDTACNSAESQKCYNVLFKTCADYGPVSCYLQAANGSIHTSCLEEAQEVYRVNSVLICQNQSHAECYQDNYDNCTVHQNGTCNAMATANCADWSVSGFLSEEDCIENRLSTCLGKTEEVCSVLSEVKCENQTDTCTLKKPLVTDVYVEDCLDVLWDNCSTCMYSYFWDCYYVHGGLMDDCSEGAVSSCLHPCYQQKCSSVFYPFYEEYIYPTCSWEEVQPTEYIYPSNCSEKVIRWHEVNVLVLQEEQIQLSLCDVPCSGDDTVTCGSEDFILISGVLEMSLVQETCEWYAGLYDPDEDILIWEFELQVSSQDTKGITELIHPLVSYTHGPEKTATLIPFAPFKLEAGRVELLMTVWTAAELTGYRPGDLIEYYTEVRHHPTSTVTARDITVWWIFPEYIQFINLTNHAGAHYVYHELQPVTVKTTESSQGITFYVPSLRNMDMISYHFLVRLDPDGTLPSGDYNLVAFAEMDYFSWDLYNPHEGDYKYNIVPFYHDPEITRIQFKVETTPILRPERDDIKLKMYSFLYDEGNNIFYICFYNRTGNRRDGGCFMTGDMIDPLPSMYPSCDEYCNCTYQDGLKEEDNCTDVMPRPANCTCGCYPDCQEELLSCQDSCMTCQDCNTTLCSVDCDLLYDNCTTMCCEEDCNQDMSMCNVVCSRCDQLLGCTVQECTTVCESSHKSCNRGCHPLFTSCQGNCTLTKERCSSHCSDVCHNITTLTEIPSGARTLKLCISTCDQNCNIVEENCTSGCCMEKCDVKSDVCAAGCMKTCNSDIPCIEDCTTVCNISHTGCLFNCDLASASCTGQCDLYELSCQEECPVECYEEICWQENIVTCSEMMDSATDYEDLPFNTTESMLNTSILYDGLNSTSPYMNLEDSTMLPSAMITTTEQNSTTEYMSNIQTTIEPTIVMDTTIMLNGTKEMSNTVESITDLVDAVFNSTSGNISQQNVAMSNTSVQNATTNSSMNEYEIFQFVNTTSNCTVLKREICGELPTTACSVTCRKDCLDTGSICRSDCCTHACLLQLQDCQAICLTNCSDDECYKGCSFACEDDYETCYNPCHLIQYHCNSDCDSGMESCVGQCLECQTAWNRTQTATNRDILPPKNESAVMDGLNSTCFCNNTVLVSNYTLGVNKSTEENYNCSCNNSSHIEPQAVSGICGKSNMSQCMQSCNSSVDGCHEDCPCEEGCHVHAASCWLTCRGCQMPCYEQCYSYCSSAVLSCQENCKSLIQTVTLYECINLCNESCLINCFTNQTVNMTCITECSIYRAKCTSQCITQYLTVSDDQLMKNSSNHWNSTLHHWNSILHQWNTSTSTEDEGLWLPTEMTFSTIPEYATELYNFSSVTASIENTSIISESFTTGPGKSTYMFDIAKSTEDTSTTVDATTVVWEVDHGESDTSTDDVTTMVWEVDHGESDSVVHSCSNRCLISHGVCLNGTQLNVTLENASTCSLQYDACIEQCIGDYVHAHCSAMCSSDNAICMQSCIRCDDCLGACKNVCTNAQDSCTLDCQSLPDYNNKFLDCAAYASCMLGCHSEAVQNCTAACLQQHISRNCSSVGNCSALEVCLPHARRKRDCSESSVVVNRTLEPFEDSVNLHRRRRTVQQSDSLDANITSLLGSNESLAICSIYQQYQNLTTCMMSCQNLSYLCILENKTHCCDLNGSCENRGNNSWCMDACYDHAPIQFRDCITDCQLTSSYCNNFSQNCSDSSQCSADCFKVCHFVKPIDHSDCLDFCSSSLIPSSCSLDCNSTCSHGNGSWSCDCTNHTMLSISQNCSNVALTNNSLHECLELVVYQPCACNCSCPEAERKVFNWRRMHLSVANILGYNSVNSTLYGLSRNGLAIMESTDFGESWRAIDDRTWSDVLSSWWFISADRLDEESLITLNETSSQFTFVSDARNHAYRVSAVGLHHQASSNWTELWDILGIWTCCNL